MLIKFVYAVKTSMVLADYWPVTMGDMKLEWIHEGERISALAVTVPMREGDKPPTWKSSSTPGVAGELNAGWTSRASEVEEAVRTLRGLISLFSYTEIDFESVRTEWLPETDEERRLVTVHGFSMTTEKADLLQPRRLGYDLVARAMLSVKAASHYEIPLGFLRRGTSAIYSGQYVEAFYNLFFFLETQYAGGYSNPKKTFARLWAAEAVRKAVSRARRAFARERRLNPKKQAELLAMTDEQIVANLVTLRGDLHHHSLHKPGVWHPDKSHHFQEEAIFLQHIVHTIAMEQSLSLMFAAERNQDLMFSARAAGAMVKIKVEATYLKKGQKLVLDPEVIELPSRHVGFDEIHAIHRHFRKRFKGDHPDIELLEYRFLSEDGSRVYAVWKRAQADGNSAAT